MSLACTTCGRWGLALLAHVLSAASQLAVVHAQDTANPANQAVAPRLSDEAQRLAACSGMAQSAWPRDAVERRALLHRMESARERCMDHPAFLAALGGTWLEEGNPIQALLWLERSLMLDAGQLGAQADHALALASLGESAALDELVSDWRKRTDIPPLLMSRLVQAGPRLAMAGRAQALRSTEWVQVREVALVFGHESNLDRSPRLSELTITPPDGSIDLTLDRPLKPRPGAASVAEASWQLAFSPSAGTIVRAGVQATARSAPGNSDTNWRHVQMAASASQRWGGWRADMLAAISTVSGHLQEPYRLVRWGIVLERNGQGCTHRFAIDIERRIQSATPTADGRSTGVLLNTQCSMPDFGGWKLGALLRASADSPEDADRAGGVQRQLSAGIRAFGPVGPNGRIDASLRVTRTLDDNGYSPLLASNARRWLRPVQFNLEYAHPAAILGMPSAELVSQFQVVRQDSNLPVFTYTSMGLFGGMRWQW